MSCRSLAKKRNKRKMTVTAHVESKKTISDKYVHGVLECCMSSGKSTQVGAKRQRAMRLSGETTGIQLKCEMHINKEAKETTSQTRPKRQRT